MLALVVVISHHANKVHSNGGQFEFLPVTVESAGVVISAALRIGVHCGIEVGTPKSLKGGLVEIHSGIEVALFANVAEFVTNITHSADDKECELKVVQGYNLAVGAIAGASIVVDVPAFEPQTWGPVIETSTAIYTTTLAEVCAIKGKPQPTSAGIMAIGEKREDLTTTTIYTSTTTTGVSCTITGTDNCPASAQVSTKAVITRTLVTAVPSGVDPTFPESSFNTVRSTIAFGPLANTIKATSGRPIAYVAPTDDVHHTSLDGEIGGVNKKLIIGLSAGLGVPVLLGLIGACM